MEVIPIYLTAFHRRLEISLDNATRRLPTERKSDNLLQTLSIPATSALIEYVCDYFRGIESEDWLVAKQHCTYINSDELSCTVVSFWYLANHTPGGKKGERAVGCLSVLGFLGSPFRRITIMIVASLYPIHLSWASFSDKAAQIECLRKLVFSKIRNIFRFFSYNLIGVLRQVAKFRFFSSRARKSRSILTMLPLNRSP